MVDARSSVGQRGTLLYMAPGQIEMKTPSPRAKQVLGIDTGANLEVTFQIEVTPAAIVHKLRRGAAWAPLDTWQDAAGNFASGKFGFLINGRDQVALSEFSHLAR